MTDSAAPAAPKKRGCLRWFLILFGFFVVCLGALAVYISTRPADYKIARSKHSDVSPDAAFAQVNDFKKWKEWSPWEKRDPNCKYTYEGPTSGVGSICAWEGNSDVGQGKMTILESKPGESIKIKLEFIKPFPSECETLFEFRGGKGGCLVTWTMTGQNGFVGKAFSLFIDMDKMIGDDFEKGLAGIHEAAAKEKK